MVLNEMVSPIPLTIDFAASWMFACYTDNIQHPRDYHANYQHVLRYFDLDVCFRYRKTPFAAYSRAINEFKASIAIPDGETLEGSLPSRQMKLVQAWIELHQDDLMADWFLATNGQTPFKIDPLR